MAPLEISEPHAWTCLPDLRRQLCNIDVLVVCLHDVSRTTLLFMHAQR